MPDSVTVKPRSRSRSASMPTMAPSSTTTYLSRMARLTTVLRPTVTPSMRTDSRTEDQEFTRTPGDSTEEMTSPPDTMTPGETIESTAWPRRSWCP